MLRLPEDALRDCDESLRLRPDHAHTLDSRALAYWLLGEHGWARSNLKRARQMDPLWPTWQERFRKFKRMF